MRKKVLTLLLVSALGISTLTACGSKDSGADVTNEPTVTQEATATPEPTATPEAVATTEPTTEPTAEPTQAAVTDTVDTLGVIKGTTYTNSEIGFSVTVPESWLLNDAEATYDYMVQMAGSQYDKETLKQTLAAQGTYYLFYGNDTQFNATEGTSNVLVQAMDSSVFGGLGVEDIITSLTALVEQQYNQMGATITTQEPKKYVADDQDYYVVSVKANISGESEGVSYDQDVCQDYIIFMKNDYLVYMAVSSANNDIETITSSIIDTFVFE